MSLQLDKQSEDIRGKIMWLSYKGRQINIVEIKKGYARGGHYHEYDSENTIILGRVEYREEDIVSGKERTKIISAPTTVLIPKNTAHILTAVEDTIFIEFQDSYSDVVFPKYRKIVEDRMRNR